jgi:predicted aconitase with swiveling domain
MILTDEEKRMRDGAEGAATAAAMDLLIRYGDALACDRLCEVRNVAGTMTQPSPVKERLVREGGWDKAFAVINLDCDTDIEVPAMRVPTCQLQHGFGADARGVVPYPAQRIALQQDAESFYGRRGVSILATCTPYQVGNIPVRGEHVAWMESSAVIYANSVLGARTNCEGTASSGAASLTGKIPCWGNHRDENRYGTHLIDVRTPVDSGLRPARLPARLGGPGPPGRRGPGRPAPMPRHRAVADAAAGAARRGRPQRVHRGDRAGRRPPAGRLVPGHVPGRPGGDQGLRHRFGQAGALPARDPWHRGLVRHPRGLRRRRRHRPLAGEALVITLHGRTVVPGYAEGEALVSPEPISGWGGIDPAAGRIIESRHALNGVVFTGKVLVFPSAKGSSGWSGFFQSTRLLGTAPIAMIITRISTKSALGAVVTRVPALTDLDQDPCAVIRTGDWVRVDATRGLIKVKPAAERS